MISFNILMKSIAVVCECVCLWLYLSNIVYQSLYLSLQDMVLTVSFTKAGGQKMFH